MADPTLARAAVARIALARRRPQPAHLVDYGSATLQQVREDGSLPPGAVDGRASALEARARGRGSARRGPPGWTSRRCALRGASAPASQARPSCSRSKPCSETPPPTHPPPTPLPPPTPSPASTPTPPPTPGASSSPTRTRTSTTHSPWRRRRAPRTASDSPSDSSPSHPNPPPHPSSGWRDSAPS